MNTIRSKAVLGTIAVLVFAALSLVRWSAESRPENAPAGVFGPSPLRLVKAADGLVDEALAALHDRERPAAERLAGHREALERAATLLERAVDVQPTSAAALARLAAVRWELDGGTDTARTFALIDRAAAAMPRSAETHMRLGDLLIGMGEPRRGMRRIARSLELAPSIAPKVVERLVARLVPVEEALTELPHSVALFEALAGQVAREGAEEPYVRAVEALLSPETATSFLLAAYSNSCLRRRWPQRSIDTLERLGRIEPTRRESVRVNVIARALLQLGRADEALQAIAQARVADPEWDALWQRAGESLEQMERWEEAIALYRRGLAELASVEGRRIQRARLYESIGRVEESRGEAGRAFDAYRLAIRLSPDLPFATKRLRRMHEAAGLGRATVAAYSDAR